MDTVIRSAGVEAVFGERQKMVINISDNDNKSNLTYGKK